METTPEKELERFNQELVQQIHEQQEKFDRELADVLAEQDVPSGKDRSTSSVVEYDEAELARLVPLILDEDCGQPQPRPHSRFKWSSKSNGLHARLHSGQRHTREQGKDTNESDSDSGMLNAASAPFRLSRHKRNVSSSSDSSNSSITTTIQTVPPSPAQRRILRFLNVPSCTNCGRNPLTSHTIREICAHCGHDGAASSGSTEGLRAHEERSSAAADAKGSSAKKKSGRCGSTGSGGLAAGIAGIKLGSSEDADADYDGGSVSAERGGREGTRNEVWWSGPGAWGKRVKSDNASSNGNPFRAGGAARGKDEDGTVWYDAPELQPEAAGRRFRDGVSLLFPNENLPDLLTGDAKGKGKAVVRPVSDSDSEEAPTYPSSAEFSRRRKSHKTMTQGEIEACFTDGSMDNQRSDSVGTDEFEPRPMYRPRPGDPLAPGFNPVNMPGAGKVKDGVEIGPAGGFAKYVSPQTAQTLANMAFMSKTIRETGQTPAQFYDKPKEPKADYDGAYERRGPPRG